MWGQLLLARYNLRDAAIYSRRLYVSPIYRRGADLMADILPRVLERERFPFSPLLYKALRRLVFLFVHQHIRSSKNSRELQRSEIYEHFRPSNSYCYLREASFLEEISKRFSDCCEDTRKLHSLRCFKFLLGFQFSLRFSFPSLQFNLDG